MRVLGASLLVAMTAAAVTLGSAPAANQAKLRPVLTIAGSNPVTIVGMRFLPRERVTIRLSVAGQAKLSRAAIASRTGRLVVRFGDQVSAPECRGFVLSAQAIGARGSTAFVRRLEVPPPCGIAPQP